MNQMHILSSIRLLVLTSLTDRSWDFDAESFGFVHRVTTITRFHGARHGKELHLVPVRSLPSAEWVAIKAECIARGHKWFELQQQFHHFNYSAMVSSNQDNTDIAHVCQLFSFWSAHC